LPSSSPRRFSLSDTPAPSSTYERITRPNAQQILCAILNRVTNFTAPYGSLIYLNWYAGETATAVIVANVPHLWPLISRVFNLGSFKQINGPDGSNKYPLRSHRSGVGIPTTRRSKYDIDGYVTTSSEERIAPSSDKDAEWGYGKKLETPESSEGNLELGKMTTSIQRDGGNVKGNNGGRGLMVKEEELGGRVDPSKKGQIVKTVHINQYANDS
jgi:hypothetical protein